MQPEQPVTPSPQPNLAPVAPPIQTPAPTATALTTATDPFALNESSLFRKVTTAERKARGLTTLPTWTGLVVSGVGLLGGVLGFTSTISFFTSGVVIYIAMIFVGIVLVGLSLNSQIQVRLYNFADDNGFRYIPKVGSSAHVGWIFSQGYSPRQKSVFQRLDTQGVPRLEFGTHEYTTGHGRSKTTHHWQYICILLDRNIPHMILDARSNNMKLFGGDISNLGMGFSKDQVISLEGNFNDHFTLYGPPEYQMDARYVFTPDLMTVLIDSATAYDAELIDNKVYFYKSGRTPMGGKPFVSYVQGVLRLYEAVLPKLQKQTQYYADERSGLDRSANVVAGQGRRLKTRTPTITIIATAIVVILYVVSFFAQ